MSAKKRILERLKLGPAPLHELRRPDIGGGAADVRLRELRREGNPIDYTYKYVGDKRTNTTIYYLKSIWQK